MCCWSKFDNQLIQTHYPLLRRGFHLREKYQLNFFDSGHQLYLRTLRQKENTPRRATATMIFYLLIGILALSIPPTDAADGCDSGGVDCLGTFPGKASQNRARALSTVYIYSPVTTITLPRRDVADTAYPTARLGPPVVPTPKTTPTTLMTVAIPAYPPTPTLPSTSASPGSPETPEYPESPRYPPPPASLETTFPTTPISSPRPEYETQPKNKAPESHKSPEGPGYLPPPATPETTFRTAPISNPSPEYETQPQPKKTQPKKETPPQYKPQPTYKTEPAYRPRAFPL
ncbi:hypothetical protein AJ78_07846 [Emergomyces pasteurianus Ep9510]|uniref:Uncharacterized protein n=1 Tax=Emergomyces pasteurianus Ep9510 TaxID=1447872 RepID=A0A1J9P5E6_9EURO|nr:hypothetical protein AJ78_07846 [Emergomyces pasteurianus Ep9510]